MEFKWIATKLPKLGICRFMPLLLLQSTVHQIAGPSNLLRLCLFLSSSTGLIFHSWSEKRSRKTKLVSSNPFVVPNSILHLLRLCVGDTCSLVFWSIYHGVSSDVPLSLSDTFYSYFSQYDKLLKLGIITTCLFRESITECKFPEKMPD